MSPRGGKITFTQKTTTGNPFNSFDVGSSATPVFIDVDKDGDLDLVVGENDGYLNYFLNESTASTITFTEQTSTDNPFNNMNFGYLTIPTPFDADGDGDLDLVVGVYLGRIFTVENYFGTWIKNPFY